MGATVPATRGAALLLCMLFTAAVTGTLLMLSTRVVSQVRHATYAGQATSALAASEAAMALARRDLQRGGNGNLGFEGTLAWTVDGRASLPGFGDTAVSPKVFPGTPEAAWFTVATTRDDLPADCIVVYAVARAGAVERRIETVFRTEETGILTVVTWREVPSREVGEMADAGVPLLGD